MIYNVEQLTEHNVKTCIKGKWVLARPLTLGFKDRLKTAWEVLCGRCDGVKWYKQ